MTGNLPELVRSNVERLKFKVRYVLGGQPAVFLRLMRARRRYASHVVHDDTEIVIEGFPRSANTFAVAAFLLAQGRPVKIAHHLHVPAQVIYAVKRGIPTLVVIRKPDDAAVSVVIRRPRLFLRDVLEAYCAFYGRILSYSHGYVSATFDEVTTDFGSVINRVNARFGTDFALFRHTEENVRKVFRMVEEMDKQDTGKTVVAESTVARPSAERQRLKEQLKKHLTTSSVASVLHKARRVYEEFLRTTRSDIGNT